LPSFDLQEKFSKYILDNIVEISLFYFSNDSAKKLYIKNLDVARYHFGTSK
jgi:hypothetical protein